MPKPLVAIVGRPNVGKSMLFNKLTGRRAAIVEDTPGVTRDRIYGDCDWNGREFELVDTGGIEPNTDSEMLQFMRRQAELAIAAADVIVMATPVYFYTMSAQMKTLIDRCCGLYTQMQNKEFYFIVTAAEDDQKKIERTIDTFQGFLDCLDGATIKGVVYGLGVWHAGEIKGNPAMQEAYDLGHKVGEA